MRLIRSSTERTVSCPCGAQFGYEFADECVGVRSAAEDKPRETWRFVRCPCCTKPMEVYEPRQAPADVAPLDLYQWHNPRLLSYGSTCDCDECIATRIRYPELAAIPRDLKRPR